MRRHLRAGIVGVFVVCIFKVATYHQHIFNPIASSGSLVAHVGCSGWQRDWLLEIVGTGPKSPENCVRPSEQLLTSSFDDNCTVHRHVPDVCRNVQMTGMSIAVIDDSTVHRARNALKCFPSPVVFLAGDEHCGFANSRNPPPAIRAIQEIVPDVLILKQYQCGMQPTSNLRFVPLGYIHGMFSGASGSVAVSQNALSRADVTRPHRWVFAGDLVSFNGERKAAYEELFRFWKPHQVVKGLDGKQLGELYASADFVLSGRGENLDCYRHYESSANGAIPIIAASKNEMNSTFGHYEPQPPWIMAESWSEALAQAKALTPAEVVQRRKKVLKWWIHTVKSLQQAVAAKHVVKTEVLSPVQHKRCDWETVMRLEYYLTLHWTTSYLFQTFIKHWVGTLIMLIVAFLGVLALPARCRQSATRMCTSTSIS